MIRATIAVIATILTASGAYADRKFSWMKPEELKAFSEIAAGYAAAYRCDRTVHTEVVSARLSRAFGGRQFSAEEVADFVVFSNTVLGMQAPIFGPITPEYCADVEKLFGPNGTAIKGFFD